MHFFLNALQVARRTDPGARPKKTKPRDEVASSEETSTSSDDKNKVRLNVSLRAFRVFISLTPCPHEHHKAIFVN